ncbi:hypothetical protein HK099_001654, partial [Clydaea vesicula]
VHESCNLILSDIVDKYFSLLSVTANDAAILCNRTEINFEDILITFHYLKINVEELKEFSLNWGGLTKITPEDAPGLDWREARLQQQSNSNIGDNINSNDVQIPASTFPRQNPVRFPIYLENLSPVPPNVIREQNNIQNNVNKTSSQEELMLRKQKIENIKADPFFNPKYNVEVNDENVDLIQKRELISKDLINLIRNKSDKMEISENNYINLNVINSLAEIENSLDLIQDDENTEKIKHSNLKKQYLKNMVLSLSLENSNSFNLNQKSLRDKSLIETYILENLNYSLPNFFSSEKLNLLEFQKNKPPTATVEESFIENVLSSGQPVVVKKRAYNKKSTLTNSGNDGGKRRTSVSSDKSVKSEKSSIPKFKIKMVTSPPRPTSPLANEVVLSPREYSPTVSSPAHSLL